MLPQEDKNLTAQRKLIYGAIKTVASLGLENTTTNAICKMCGINVSYIYQSFSSKEDLIAKSFAFADEEFLSVILSNYTVLNYESLDYESRCRVLFTKCWDHYNGASQRADILCPLLLFHFISEVCVYRTHGTV